MNLLKVVKRNKIQRICALLAVGVLALTACRRVPGEVIAPDEMAMLDRKSTRLNSSHL